MMALALALLLAFPLATLAAPVEPGHFLPRLTLKNQHDQKWYIPAVTLIRPDGGRVTHLEYLMTDAQVRYALGL